MAYRIIVSDFSRTPGGRFRADGPHSGEEFREDVLWPALRDHRVVEVDLSGTLGFGSSFLEEVFGGLVRTHGDALSDLASNITVVPETSSYAHEALGYLKAAIQERGTSRQASA